MHYLFVGPAPPGASIVLVGFENVIITITASEDNEGFKVSYFASGFNVTLPKFYESAHIVVEGLTPGTNYTFQVYSIFNGVKSDRFTSLESYTRKLICLFSNG